MVSDIQEGPSIDPRAPECYRKLVEHTRPDFIIWGGDNIDGRKAKTADELRAEFVTRMNRRARELGMRDTHYISPNGLPNTYRTRREFDVSTAADLAELGKVLVRMPKALSYTSRPWCKVTDGSGNPLTLAAHNYFLPGTRDAQHLCTPMPECDGLKTGYTSESGNSIMLTAKRNGRRVIVVVLGSRGRHNREKAAGIILRDALDAICIW